MEKIAIEKIVNLKEHEVGPTEENVKQKVVVPLLELLGHKRENLEFEYRTRSGGKMDIFIKNVPRDCKVIIDTKNYSENLNDHIDQIKEYTFDESALLTILVNGTELRIYSPLRGIAFERSLLYSFKIKDLANASDWALLSSLLHEDNLLNRTVHDKINEREREIKDTIAHEDKLKAEYESKIESIDSDIESKEDEILLLKSQKEQLEKEILVKVNEIWQALKLPLDLYSPTSSFRPTNNDTPFITSSGFSTKARRVALQELANEGLIRNGQVITFYNTRLFSEEKAEINIESNKIKYKADGKLYTVSDLAKILLIKHGFKHDDHGVRGPIYWKTENGKSLNDLNEVVRAKRGDRK